MQRASLSLKSSHWERVTRSGEAVVVCVADPLVPWCRSKFKPFSALRSPPPGRNKLIKAIQTTMDAAISGDMLRQAMKLPKGEDVRDWIAMNGKPPSLSLLLSRFFVDGVCAGVYFYNAASLVFSAVNRFCTISSCPTLQVDNGYSLLAGVTHCVLTGTRWWTSAPA